MLQRLLCALLPLVLLTACSQTTVDRDLLNRLADVHYVAPFQFDDERSVMLVVDLYKNGVREQEPAMYFGNYFTGTGSISFTYFLPDTAAAVTDAFFLAAIEDDTQVAKHTLMTTVPSPFIRFSQKNDVLLTNSGDYLIGAIAFLTAETAASITIPSLDVQPRADVIDAYKPFRTVYVITAQVD